MILALFLACLSAQDMDYIEVFVSDKPEREVFLTTDEVAAARERAGRAAWARSAAGGLTIQANTICAAELDIPHFEGQWTQWYTCGQDGAPLEFRESEGHVCPVCGKVYTGEKYDKSYYAYRHRFWAEAADTLGWAYTLNSTAAYAARVRAILLEYASFYQTLPVHDREGGKQKSPGRLHAQALEEAMSLVHFCVGYERTYHADCYTKDDHTYIESKLIRPMVEMCKTSTHDGSNWMAWKNTAVGCAGFLLQDADLVEWAINGPYGFLYQMNERVLPGGMWYEESLTYHWFALRAFIYLMEAARRVDIDLYAHPSVKKMFDAPLQLLFPDMTFPAINDSDRSKIRDVRALYEVAYRRFGDERYRPLLEPRDTEWALFWGVDAPEDAPPAGLSLSTVNLEHLGLAILRDAAGQTAAYLDYGGAALIHTHPARLGLVLYAQGDERFVDPGRIAYGNPLHQAWYRETVAHNTVVIGQKSQANGAARLAAYGSTDGYSLARGIAETAYDSTTLDRTIVMRGSLVLDVVQCHASQETTIDLPLHLRGAIAELPGAEACEPLGDQAGYQLLQETRKFPARLESLDLMTGDKKGIRIRFHDGGGETFLARGFGATPQELLPVIIQRKTARDTIFVSTYELFEDAPPVQPAIRIEQSYVLTVSAGDWSLELSGDTAIVEKGSKTFFGPEGAVSTRSN